MPEIIPLIVPILTGAAAATGIGTSIYSAVNQPGAPKAPAAAQPTPADALKARQTQQAALLQQLPGIDAATEGSLSPESKLRMAELMSGQGGNPGIGASIQDLLQRMSGVPFAVSAGNATSPSGSTTGLSPGSSYG